MFKSSSIALTFGLVAQHIQGTHGSIYTVSDDRIRSLDISPVLGRGYSIMTNAYHSTCLMVDEVNVPTYNYDYYYTDFTRERESAFESKISSSFGNGDVKKEYETTRSSSSKQKNKTRMIVTTMRIERYYSSLREEVSPLSTSAAALLNNEDYIGFFKACGPNYIRGIRRAQEVTAIFQFRSSSQERASQFTAGLQVSNWKHESKSKYKAASSSLTIKITGYGLGLSSEGSDTLVAATLADYGAAMKFAFNSMTKNEDADHVGMVYGMEVLPWVHNTEFQAASALGDELIETPMPRSLIPRAYTKDPKLAATTFYATSSRSKFRCKNLSFKIDKFGYCCESEQLFMAGDYVDADVYTGTGSDAACVPIRALDPSMIKDNMSNNGEFIARMDSGMRYRLTTLAVLEKCISAANSIPDRLLTKKLLPKDTVKYDGVVEIDVTLVDLKLSIDPKGNFSVLEQLAKELDEWIEMFYQPCYAALYGTNVGVTPDVDVSFFMAYPWHHHDECMKLSCLTTTLRWDRVNGGCIPGIMSGNLSKPYSTGETNCAKDTEKNDAEEKCKYDSTELETNRKEATDCAAHSKVKNTQFYLENYCMPQLTSTNISPNPKAAYDTCRAPPTP